MKRTILLFAILSLLFHSCRNGKDAPLVGISCGRTSSGSTLLSSNYTDAILHSGGVPVVFPTIATEEEARSLVASVDALVFSGGPDLDPSHYGETVWNGTVQVDTLRDVSDLLLMRSALASGKPILGICRGGQLLNVVLGGSLYQDIPTQVDTLVSHSAGSIHRIGVEKGSVLYRLFGQDSLTVNSSHHQAVKQAAPGIRVTARSRDGIVEAYEYGDRLLAVQFHPEKMAVTDESWLALFRYFLSMAQD